MLGYKLANASWRNAEAAIAADRNYSRGPGDAGRLLESRLRLLWRRRCKHAMRGSWPRAYWRRTVTQANTADRSSCSSIIPSIALPGRAPGSKKGTPGYVGAVGEPFRWRSVAMSRAVRTAPIPSLPTTAASTGIAPNVKDSPPRRQRSMADITFGWSKLTVAEDIRNPPTRDGAPPQAATPAAGLCGPSWVQNPEMLRCLSASFSR